MAQQITDLDLIVGGDKKVKLRGKVYTLPADVPVPLYLKIVSSEGDLTQPETIKELYDDILELFRYGDAKIKELPIGLTQLITLIGSVYGGGATDGPPPKPKASTRSTAKK